MLALEALASHLSLLIGAVYGWSGTTLPSDEGEHCSTLGQGLMELMPRGRLEDQLDSCGSEAKRNILQQIAVISQKLQAHQLPDSTQGFWRIEFRQRWKCSFISYCHLGWRSQGHPRRSVRRVPADTACYRRQMRRHIGWKDANHVPE